MKAYILVFNAAQVDRKRVQRAIDRFEGVVNWYAFFDNVICLASEHPLRALTQYLREEFPDLNFLVTPVDSDQKGGWMPQSIWSFLDNPQPAGADA